MEKGNYKTKQKEELIKYLETVPGKHVTIADVVDYFKSTGNAIGTTTVYRQMEKLVDDGLVNKYNFDANTPACFEYIPKGDHDHHSLCFHCKCTKCGKLIHLHCEELEHLGSHIAAEHGFLVDSQRTVFYGLCEACRLV